METERCLQCLQEEEEEEEEEEEFLWDVISAGNNESGNTIFTRRVYSTQRDNSRRR
jgi:hypothetical protein